MLKNANMEIHLPGYSKWISWVMLVLWWFKIFLNDDFCFRYKSFSMQLELTYKQEKQNLKINGLTFAFICQKKKSLDEDIPILVN